MTVNVHVVSDWARGDRKEVDERRPDDGQRHSGATLVENGGLACAVHGGSRIPNTTRSRERLKVSECSR